MVWTIDEAWTWLGVGLAFLILELATGSLFLIWAGLAACAIAGVVFAFPSLPLAWQLILFATIAVATTYLGRNYFRGRVGADVSDRPLLNRRAAQLTGRRVFAIDAFTHGEGRVQLADSPWSARLAPEAEDAAVAGGDALIIQSVEGSTLIVAPAGG